MIRYYKYDIMILFVLLHIKMASHLCESRQWHPVARWISSLNVQTIFLFNFSSRHKSVVICPDGPQEMRWSVWAVNTCVKTKWEEAFYKSVGILTQWQHGFLYEDMGCRSWPAAESDWSFFSHFLQKYAMIHTSAMSQINVVAFICCFIIQLLRSKCHEHMNVH